jgi:hypothetical protein
VSLIAKTGIYDIPVFTKIFYQQPMPIHEVIPSPNQAAEWEKKMQINPFSAEQVKKVEFTEGDLTTMFWVALEKAGAQQGKIAIKTGQIAVDQNQVELFAEFTAPFHALVSVGLLPQIENQQLVFKTESLRIGNLEVPFDFTKNLISSTLNTQMSKGFEGLPIILKRVSLEAGKIVIEFEFDQSKLPKINAK